MDLNKIVEETMNITLPKEIEDQILKMKEAIEEAEEECIENIARIQSDIQQLRKQHRVYFEVFVNGIDCNSISTMLKEINGRIAWKGKLLTVYKNKLKYDF